MSLINICNFYENDSIIGVGYDLYPTPSNKEYQIKNI